MASRGLHMASNGTTLGMVSPPPSVMSTSTPSTLSQSKHWISVPSTNPTDKGPGDGLGGKKEATCGPSIDRIGGDGIWASSSRGVVAYCVIEEKSGRLGATREGSVLREAINSVAWMGLRRLGVTGDSGGWTVWRREERVRGRQFRKRLGAEAGGGVR
uniref:Uncharacterized protein n=1 Tax=Oryza nivara TaxID=4536 RepID=A0A0E0GU40_ORYNI